MARTIAPALVFGMMLAAGTARLVAGGQAPPEACFAREMVPSQLRPLSCRMAAVVNSGIARSATFRGLVERVGHLNGIVYIKGSFYVNKATRIALSGALSHHISRAGQHTVLHLMVAPESGDRPVITLAHELQHAIEVLQATGVATEAEVDQLFERVGIRVSAGVMETQAALDMASIVARELRGR